MPFHPKDRIRLPVTDPTDKSSHELERFVLEGLRMIKHGDPRNAQQYFTDSSAAESVGVPIQILDQSCRTIENEADLWRTTRRAYTRSGKYFRGAVFYVLMNILPSIPAKGGNEPTNVPHDFEYYPDRFKPDLIRDLLTAEAKLSAETYLIALQDRHGSLTGAAHHGVDRARYFEYGAGMRLTPEEATRSWALETWALENHPSLDYMQGIHAARIILGRPWPHIEYPHVIPLNGYDLNGHVTESVVTRKL